MTDVTTDDRAVVDAPDPSGRDEMAPAVRVRGLRKEFTTKAGKVGAIDDMDLTIGRGEFVCIVGPSGCGKTTLLNILAGLDQPSQGEVNFDLADASRPRRSVVFQEQGVFPWMTVLENATFGLRVRGMKRERYAIARALLRDLGLEGFENAFPSQLSGGMRQRVNIARAFATDAQLLLLDEPFGSLDEQTKLCLQDDLLRVWEGARFTALFVTHSIDEAIRMGDRVVVMTARPGQVKAEVRVELPRPRDVFEMQAHPEYSRIRERVWTALKDEVLAVRGQAGAE